MTGRSSSHGRILDELASAAQTDVEVLLMGPSGVGKEVYARWLHQRSPRAAGEFVPVNCGAVPVGLLENELFGHVGGAFTGARPSSEGLVAEADGGTLFLDEIDALEPSGQVKLLRFLQQREYRRLGENRLRKANVRIVAATNADLARLVRESRFREDLFFRVHVFPVRVPPLRERRDDIEPLLSEFVDRCAALYRMRPVEFTPEAFQRLQEYSWPGNVRELENCVRYLTSLGLDRPVKEGDLKLLEDEPADGLALPLSAGRHLGGNGSSSLRDAKRSLVSDLERNFVVEALRGSRGNIARAARAIGKPRRAFFELMRKHAVCAGDYRGIATPCAARPPDSSAPRERIDEPEPDPALPS